MKLFRNLGLSVAGMLAAMLVQSCATAPDDAVRTSKEPYFIPATQTAKAPDADGFLQRWLLLEPIRNSLRSNAGFTESFIRSSFSREYFPNQFSVVPCDGDTVTVEGEHLKWHALDAVNFNVKLFRFASQRGKPVYGVTFWAVTVIDSPQEMKNVRLAVGSNSASMWWLNGEEAVALFGDKRMVMDEGVSRRLTLKKGMNVIRGAVINGPGMSDFCVRFLDEEGNPIKDLKLDLSLAESDAL
ncbi:MAG: hypothetical protein JXR25_17280 [Pontiellaceae bacterium]|nr:hypothetical protein [Pontiellaceae bacterium]MBN2786573.1 hypothetical protein [Pontiellaceae bacterium]